MDDWNFDISQAPKGSFKKYEQKGKGDTIIVRTEHQRELILAADQSGTVVNVSYWWYRPLTPKERADGVRLEDRDPNDGQWSMYTKECPPMAWMPWPKHPKEAT